MNFFILLFIIFNPELVFNTKMEKVNLINPKVTIGNNGRIISFVDKKEEFNSLCIRARSDQVSICDYKENIKKIETVKGCDPVTFLSNLSKNKFHNNFLIQEIEYIDNDNNKQLFKVSDLCVYENQDNRTLFYIFYFMINISIFFYLFQFKKKG